MIANNFMCCGNLCDKCFITSGGVKSLIKKFSCRKDNDINIERIIKDLDRLLQDEEFDNKFICNHILNKLVQLTNSEYGFIGKIVETENGSILHIYSFTNIAWNSASNEFYHEHYNRNLYFTNMNTLFGDTIKSGKYTICNNYDKSRNVLPSGHPLIHRFMAVPSLVGGKCLIVAGFCNKFKKYTKKNAKDVEKILNLFSLLFIDLSETIYNTERELTDINGEEIKLGCPMSGNNL